MGEIIPGIPEVYLAAGSAAWPAAAVGVHGLGYDGKGSLAITPYNPTKGDKGINIVTYENHKVEKKTNQFGNAFMKFLMGALKANDVSCKVITSGVITGASYTAAGGIFTYDNTNSLGLDLKIELSEKDASMTLTMEKAFKKATSDTLKTAAKTGTLPVAVNLPALDDAALPVGGITPAFGTVTIAEDRLSNWKVTLTFVSTKNGMNRSLGYRVLVEIEGTLSGPDPDEILDITDFEIAPDVTIAIPVEVPYNIVFESGRLGKLGETIIDDDKREGTVKLAGEYDLNFIDITGADIVFKSKLVQEIPG